MFRVDKIQEGFVGQVGFKNPTLAGYNMVSAENQASVSGLHFGGIGSVVSMQIIKDLQEDPKISDNAFNALLTQMQKDAALEVCNGVFQGMSDFLGLGNIYPFEKSFNETETLPERFVAFKLQQLKGSVICSVPWVELSFDEEVTFNLYLYNSNKPSTPIQTKEVTTSAGESIVVSLDWIVADDATYKGGIFYMGYFASDLGTAKPYKKNHNLSSLQVNAPCYNVEPVYLEYESTKINVEKSTYTSNSHGMNIGINVYVDYTEQILMNKRLFWQAIRLQVHNTVLNMMLTTTRSNITERISESMLNAANIEYYGSKEIGVTGVSQKLENEIANIRKMLFYVPTITKSTLSR